MSRWIAAMPRRGVRLVAVCAAIGVISVTVGACSDSGDAAGASSSQSVAEPAASEISGENPWLGKADISLFLCQRSDPRTGNCTEGEATPAQRDAIDARLRSLPEVEQVWYETKEQAFRSFLKQNPDSPLAENLTVDQVPDSFRVKLVNPAEVQAMADQLGNLDGVFAAQPIKPLNSDG